MNAEKEYHIIQVFPRMEAANVRGRSVKSLISRFTDIETGDVLAGKLYILDYRLTPEQLKQFAGDGLSDSIAHTVSIDAPIRSLSHHSYLVIAKLPGVTDDEGASAQRTLFDMFEFQEHLIEENTLERQHVFSQEIFLFTERLTSGELDIIASQFLGNPLIHHFTHGYISAGVKLYVPQVHIVTNETTETVHLPENPEELQRISDVRLLSLNLEEMRTVKSHFDSPDVIARRKSAGLPASPTDCELEVIAQTWSEHCKHKEFNAEIKFTDHSTGRKKRIDSLFNTYIKAATSNVKKQLEEKNNRWLVKVFSDNAGAVRMNSTELFIWKVETHNSPSAIDPYGGAITGILGNNRDPLGTGIGGARLLFNTNVLCFGPPDYGKPLLEGQLHPRRVFEGVRKGIEDGGNKSGIPTVNGGILFDDRFSGKPLVFCGTAGILPDRLNGRESWHKEIFPGDVIVSIGGRVGKDGIHGATFSSRELDESSPQSAVQIGSPITQKLASDFLITAAREGLVRASTDCGAGGLSSAVGELATIPNGAEVELSLVPLKYSGLTPWEIFLSESQERMLLAVDPKNLKPLLEMARAYDVEATAIGAFNDSGMLTVRYKDIPVAFLELDFLHNGVPKKYLEAEWTPPEYNTPKLPLVLDYEEITHKLLSSYAICSRESVIRQYDHEVKGRTVIKPLMGSKRAAPQDAAVLRLSFENYEGVAVANGIMPKFVESDPYHSAAGAFDEAVRQIIAVGGRLPNQSESDSVFWSVNDNFCVPDSVYHAKTNPDGKRKLAQLVLMCEALYDMSTFFCIPMTSGKDSMKNDFKAGSEKISVPPTVLFSAAAKIPDIRKAVTSEFKAPGDLIYQIGHTFQELRDAEFAAALGISGGYPPVVRKELAKNIYLKMMTANELGIIRSAHDLSDGGLLIAVIESCFGNMLGAEIRLSGGSFLKTHETLFAESHSRFVVSIHPRNKQRFESIMQSDAYFLGKVEESPELIVRAEKKKLFADTLNNLYHSWTKGFTEKV